MTPVCGDCGTDQEPANWSWAWNLWLCFLCRAKRTDTELRVKPSCKPSRAALPPETVLQL